MIQGIHELHLEVTFYVDIQADFSSFFFVLDRTTECDAKYELDSVYEKLVASEKAGEMYSIFTAIYL